MNGKVKLRSSPDVLVPRRMCGSLEGLSEGDSEEGKDRSVYCEGHVLPADGWYRSRWPHMT
jgi:hypothetical protein